MNPENDPHPRESDPIEEDHIDTLAREKYQEFVEKVGQSLNLDAGFEDMLKRASAENSDKNTQ